MAKDLFNRYIWLVDTIYRVGKITFEEINERWVRSEMSGGEEIPLRTFHNHRKAIEELFDINIECNKRDGYSYYIENKEDIEKAGVRNWLLNTFAVNNLINESRKLKTRILFEEIPSGRQYLTPIIEAMRDNFTIELTYQSFWRDEPHTFRVEPYCVKVFKQRWYVVGRAPHYDEIRTYALERIHGFQITEKSFVYPKDFDPQSYFFTSFGITVDESCEIERIRIKTLGNKTKYIQALPLHHSQQEVERTAEYSIFEYLLRPTYDFCQELLSHGSDLEVLSPQPLREQIKSIVKNMEQFYG
jgi:hypothetical protein